MRKLMNLLAVASLVALGLTLPTEANAADTPAAAAPAKAEAATPATKAGDTVYVCGCGAGCPCGTIKTSPGKCSCGSPLVKTTVLRVEGDQVIANPDGKAEQKFKAP